MRRLAPIMIPMLIAMQVLLAIPAIGLAHAAVSQGTHGSCHEGAMPAERQHCPCCPEGAKSMSGCLVACALAAGITSSPALLRSSSASCAEYADIVPSFDTRFEPPLKPPPIG